jgi:hypothetical protein
MADHQQQDDEAESAYEDLSRALESGASFETINNIVTRFPLVLQTRDGRQRLPLHWACCHEVSSIIIELLVERCAEAAGLGDSEGWLPLHLACMFEHNSLTTIKYLIAAYPTAMTTVDDQGYTPFHEACISHTAFDEILKYLLEQSPPEILAFKTAVGGYAPLHDAIFYGVSIEVVCWIIERDPESLYLLTNDRQTDLHMAARATRGPMVRYLVKQWPSSCLVLDETGQGAHDLYAEMVEDDTRIAVIALLMVCRYISESLARGIEEAITTRLPQLLGITSKSPFEIHQSIRPYWNPRNPQLVHAILDNDELQNSLFDRAILDLVDGAILMMQAGLVQARELNHRERVRVLLSVTDNASCLYLHLRNNDPSLWDK